MPSKPRALPVVLALAGGWLGAQTAGAVEVDAAAQFTSEYTSNTLRTESDEIGEWVFLPGVDLSVAEESPTLELDVDYSYIRRMYTKGYWQDENRLTGLATADWHAVGDRLGFLLSNVRTESTERALETATQDNRQIVSTTEAGGRLNFHPRRTDELQFEYVFRDVHTTRTQTDSYRHNFTGRYVLGLSENRQVRSSATYSDIEYDGPFPEAEYTVVLVGYAQTSGALELELDFGYNWFNRIDRGKVSDPTFSGSLSWQPTTNATIALLGSKMLTDQGSGLRSGDFAAEDTGVNATFEESIGRFTYAHRLGANTVGLEGYWTRQVYADDVPLTNTRTGGRVDFTRRLTRTTDLQLYADYSNRDFRDASDDQNEFLTGFRVEHRLGRSLNLNWGIRYEERDAETTESYKEWIGAIQVYWTFWGASRSQGQVTN